MNRLRRAIASLLARIRPKPVEPFKVQYAAGACHDCGSTSAVLDGRCWYCRTGNEPVSEPMQWTGD